MNKRQKKKFIKKNMTKLRKIHPSEGDIVVLQWNPDSEYIDFDTIVEFYKAGENAGIFDKCGTAIVPCDFMIFSGDRNTFWTLELKSFEGSCSFERTKEDKGIIPVSYTHLTLPTN